MMYSVLSVGRRPVMLGCALGLNQVICCITRRFSTFCRMNPIRYTLWKLAKTRMFPFSRTTRVTSPSHRLVNSKYSSLENRSHDSCIVTCELNAHLSPFLRLML